MTAPTQSASPVALPLPEINRRPRRRRGLVILAFALVCFVFTGFCVVWLFSDETQNSPEGMLALALVSVGLMAATAGIVLLVLGLVLMVKRTTLRQAAWLEDPADRTRARWWDGAAWSDHTSPRDPAVVALAPLTSSSRRRHRWGLALLVGGVAVALGAELASHALFQVPRYAPPPADGGLPQQVGGSDLWMYVGQLTLPAAAVAVVGLYLLLTLADDPMAGWSTDPLDPSRMRWWDGRSWTDLTSDTTIT